MNARLKLCTFAFVSGLMIMIVGAPTTAQAGTITIRNDNCTTLKWFKRRKWVKVHMFSLLSGCTDRVVRVNVGEARTFGVVSRTTIAGERITCKYAHEAKGTIAGAIDAKGTDDTTVTCKKDGFNVCQCVKDYHPNWD